MGNFFKSITMSLCALTVFSVFPVFSTGVASAQDASVVQNKLKHLSKVNVDGSPLTNVSVLYDTLSQTKPYISPNLDTTSSNDVNVIVQFNREPAAVGRYNAKIGKQSINLDSSESTIRSEHSSFENSARVQGLNTRIKREFTTVLNGMEVTIPANQIHRLASLPGVKSIYKNETFYPLDLSLADETRLVPQNVLKPSQATTATISDTVYTVTPTFDSIPLDQIHARDAWNSGYTGAGLKVGVLDTGIDYFHPDLKDAYKGGYDSVNQDNDPYEDLPDPNTNFPGTEHGTHVAGTIAGRATNIGSSIVQKGVAYNVNLYAYKVLGRFGSTTNVSGSTAQIIDGIEHAVQDGMDVINMSLGNNDDKNPNSPEAIAVNNAVLSGVVVVIANGNAASNTAYSYTAGTPASSQLGIAVGAVDSQTAQYSGSATSSFDNQHAFTLNAMAWIAQQHDFSNILGTNPLEAVYVGLGDSADYNGKNVNGKVVLVSRGKLAFVDKIANAKTNGAKAVIIFNGNVNVNSNTDPDLSASISGRDGFIGVVLGDGFDYIPTFDMEGTKGRALAAQISANPTIPLTFNFGASYSQSFVAGDHMASFSSRGPGLDGNYDVKPDFVAPGVNVWSTMPEYKKVNSTATYNNAYIRLSGTSMATPHVTGAALLIKQAHPTWTPFDIRAALSNTADETVDQNGVLNDIYSQGSGRINVLKAIQTPALLESLSHLTILDSNLIPQDVMGYDGNVSFGLVAAGSNSKTELLQVKNTSNQAQTYHASVQMHSDFTTDPVLHTTVPNASKIVPSLTGISSSNDITVAASAIQQLNLQLAVATDADEGVYEGEVTLTSSGLPSLHLPFAIHVGNTVPDANLGLQQLSISNPVLTPAKNKTDVSFRLTAKDVNIIFLDVYDLDNNYVGFLDYYDIHDTNNNRQMIPPGNYLFSDIPGTYYDSNGNPNQLPDGKYTLQVSGFNDSNFNIYYLVSGNLGVNSSSSTVTDLTEARAQFKPNIANTTILNQKVLTLPTSAGFTYSVTNSSMPSLIDLSGTLLALPLSGHMSVTLQVRIALAADPSKFTTVDVDVNLSTLPTVAGVNPANQATIYTSMPVITAYVDDADTGIDPNSIAVKINGFMVPSVYNPAYKTVTAVANHLPKGSYLLTIDASNKAGNKAQQWSSTFKVDINNTAGKVRYLALGDSLAAGWTPNKSIGVGYTDMLAEHIHRVDFLGEFNKNFAYPGYTTQNVLDNIRNNVKDPNGITIQDNITNAGVITLNAGANDFLQNLDANFSMDPNKIPALLTQIGQNTGSIILEIRRLNPAVPIYIMGYYDAFHNFPLPNIQKQQLSGLLDQLNQTIALAAQQTGAIFVPTKNAIAADYPNNLPNPSDIHPSPKGYAVIADALWNVMQSQFVWPQGSSLTATQVAATSLTLNWTPANGGVTAYKIYQGTNELGTVAGNVYALDVVALVPDTTYTFKVEAALPNGTWTKNGPAVTQTTVAPDITAPVIGSVTPANGTTITTAAPLISAVLTETGSGIDPTSIKVKVDNQTLQTSYNAANATVTAATYSFANGSHALTIDVTDLAGNHALQWSSSFTVIFSTPGGGSGGGGGPVWPQGSSLTATQVAATSLTLNWTPANGGVTAYKIYQGTNELGTVAGNVYAFDVAALLPDTTYSFKVEAELPNGTWTTNGPAVTQKTTVAPDITAPVIGSVTPANGTTVTTAAPLISAVLTETGSGIDPTSIKVKVDNQTLQTSYNAANATVTAATYSFANGSHALTIDVTDLAGNHALQWSSSFTVNVNSSSGYTGGGGGSALPSINELSINELKDLIQKSGTSTSLSIDLKKDAYILLPSNIGELLQLAQKKVIFLSDGKSIEIPASVLISLAKLISGDAAANAQIRVTLKAIESSDTSSLVDAANQTSGANIKQNGTLYEFDLTIETKDGKTSRLDHFSEPVTIRFTLVSNGTNKGLLGIYYLNELLKQWEYVGGTLNRENGTFEANLSHNSKYAVLEYTKTYSDVPSGHWAFNTIQALSAKHVIEGVSNQEFGPAQLTTRAQFVTLLVRVLGIQYSEGQSSFIDVAQGQWYSDAITAAVRAGIVKGVDESHFAPNATITREQMAVMLVRAYEYKKGTPLKSSNQLAAYQDANNVSSWANSDVNKAINAGFMQGRDEGRFVPEATTTRAETAKAISNLLDK